MSVENLQIIYEDNHLIAVNKRASDIVQADKTGDVTLGDHLKVFLKNKYNKPGEVFLGVIHRLDRPVSGVVLFAKTSKALARMNELFRSRDLQKTYWACVGERPPNEAGTLVHWLKKTEATNKSHASVYEKKGYLKCELNYKLIASSERYFLIEVDPITGRHHQIRVQLATMGCHIKGDVKYGARRGNPDASIHLHSRRLEFVHPIRDEKVVIVADPPNDPVWNAFVKQLEA